MKAAIVDGRGGVRLVKGLPMPKAGPYQCLCKTLACATCSGTDIKIMDSALPWQEAYPGILGHESIGRVIERGPGVRYMDEGDLVLRTAAAYPGQMLGGYHSLWGGFAEYGIVTDMKAWQEDEPDAVIPPYAIYQQSLPRDASIDPANATIIITLKELSSFLSNIGAGFGSSVAVLGTGPVAMGIVFFAKLYGAYPVIVIGRRDEALQRFMSVGADCLINNRSQDMKSLVEEATAGRGVDFIIDAAGDEGLINDAVPLLSRGGALAPYAVSHSSRRNIDSAAGPGTWKMLFSGPSEEKAHQYLMYLGRMKLLPLDTFYSHRMPFTEIEAGFDMLRKREAFKIVFEMEE